LEPRSNEDREEFFADTKKPFACFASSRWIFLVAAGSRADVQYQLRLERYARDLRDFEDRYGMDTPTFHKRFEAGELGDSADFFEWAGLYDLQQDLIDKIHRLELAL